jgi:hypothetical protein
MASEARKERFRAVSAKDQLIERGCRPQSPYSEPGQGKRMRREVNWGRQDLRDQYIPVTNQGLQQAPVRFPVRADAGFGFLNAAAEHRWGSPIDWVNKWKWRLDPLKSMIAEWERPEERRCHGHGVYGRPNVMDKSGQCKRKRPSGAPNGSVRLAHQHGKPGMCQNDRRRQTVRAGADYDRIIAMKNADPPTSAPCYQTRQLDLNVW